jgi:hypothetical protein
MDAWTLKKGATPLFSAPRVDVIRSFLFNHWYHHRGQHDLGASIFEARHGHKRSNAHSSVRKLTPAPKGRQQRTFGVRPVSWERCASLIWNIADTMGISVASVGEQTRGRDPYGRE